MIAVIRRLGVTSKAGLATPTPSGAMARPSSVGDLVGVALLDRDVGAVGDGEVDGGERGGDVEGDVVRACQDGDAVGADLVGGVAVGGDAVGADDDGVDLALAA